jgi:HK97 family phage portal protein
LWKRGTKQQHTTQSEIQTKSLAAPEAWLRELFGVSVGASGIAVTPQSAMQCAPFKAGARAITETVGQLPIHVYRRSDGSKERAPDHPAYALLHDAANEWTPATKFKEDLTSDALLSHGGFAFINRVDGKLFELQRLNPECVEVTYSEYGEPIYKHRVGATVNEIKRTDILHIPSPALPGSSIIKDARDAIGLALIMEQHANKLFANGARPSGILTYKGEQQITSDQFDKTIAIWKAAHGAEKSGGTAALPQDWNWVPLTFSSVDAQFLELRKFSIAEIARHLGVPLTFLAEYDRATFANAADMNQQFLTHCIMPWVNRWQGEIALKLFTPDERKVYFAEFLTDALVKADIAVRYEAYAKAIASRILNPNEVRAYENLPPYAGGDEYQNPNTTSEQASPEKVRDAA